MVIGESSKNLNGNWAEEMEKEIEEPMKPQVIQDKKSWANLFKHNRSRSEECKLSYVLPIVNQGVKIMKIKPLSIEKEVNRWKNTSIGCIYGLMPNFKRVEKFAINRWQSLGLKEVHWVKGNVFLFLFESAKGKYKVLEDGPMAFDRHPVLFREWEERLDVSFEACRLPVWIQLPCLPLEFWSSDSLSSIASVIDRPLFSDQCTNTKSRLSYARILVELEVGGDFPSEIILEVEGQGQYNQSVVYEWRPQICERCKGLGHHQTQCSTRVLKEWRPKQPPIEESGNIVIS